MECEMWEERVVDGCDLGIEGGDLFLEDGVEDAALLGFEEVVGGVDVLGTF